MLTKIIIILFAIYSSVFAQRRETILTYDKYMERIESLIPEMKLTASIESNAYNDLIRAKSSGDVKFDLQAGAIGTQNYFEQYTFLPQ